MVDLYSVVLAVVGNFHECHNTAGKGRIIIGILSVWTRLVVKMLCTLSMLLIMVHINYFGSVTLRWRHNDRDGVSNHQPRDCLLNLLFRRGSKKTSKLRVTCLCARNLPGIGEFPHKWPVTRKMFPFDDVIMKEVQVKCIFKYHTHTYRKINVMF